MRANGNGDGDDRRGQDRRSGDRRATWRGGLDRRRGDRRGSARLLLLVALALGRSSVGFADVGLRPSISPPQTLVPQGPLPGADRRGSPRRGPRPYRPLIQKAALAHGVDAALVEAVMRVESAFNPRAVSHKGAQGLMQLMPHTATRFGVKNAFDPEQNILGGTRYLAWLLEQFGGDVSLACAAYNAGEKVVLRYGGIPPYRETREYVTKIARLLGNGEATPPTLAAAPPPAPPRDTFFYTWKDARGILNVSQYPPPAGQAFEKHKLR
jgi:hypothetical protein